MLNFGVRVLLGFLAIRISYGNLASISFPGILVALKRAVVILYSTHFCLVIAASILSYRFRSLANSVFGEFPWQNETNGRLYFSAGDGRTFVVVG